jgi:ribosomal-protein-alanine N-acetyltransferase
LRAFGRGSPELHGSRVVLRGLRAEDFGEWQEVRRRCAHWLTKWEPRRVPGAPDPVEDKRAFSARCSARDRERELGTGYGFGIFVAHDGAELRFAGEINISMIQRGPFQNAYVGYWIDERVAGNGYTPESLAAVLRFAFEDLGLHRIQVAIIPRNQASRRVADKLEMRDEGVALRYLEINGTWEDHVRYAMTAEDWDERGAEVSARWLMSQTG